MQFADLVGKNVSILIPVIHATKLQDVTIVGVENGGIWIESQTLTNFALQSLKIAASPKSLRWFVPYSGIALAMTGGGGPALDESAFGV
jgi:hypothetical protein